MTAVIAHVCHGTTLQLSADLSVWDRSQISEKEECVVAF